LSGDLLILDFSERMSQVASTALLAYTRFGEHWLEEVNSISSKRGISKDDQDIQDTQDVQQLPFAEFGRDILPKYAKKFLKMISLFLFFFIK
jgi:hypothetical protein